MAFSNCSVSPTLPARNPASCRTRSPQSRFCPFDLHRDRHRGQMRSLSDLDRGRRRLVLRCHPRRRASCGAARSPRRQLSCSALLVTARATRADCIISWAAIAAFITSTGRQHLRRARSQSPLWRPVPAPTWRCAIFYTSRQVVEGARNHVNRRCLTTRLPRRHT